MEKLEVRGSVPADLQWVLSEDALAFVGALAGEFSGRVRGLLAARAERQRRLDAGEERFDFLPETRAIREGAWRAAPLPADLLDRRVEITGPPERKMVINALNSGAQMFMADFEDANAPTWSNLLQGQANLRDAVAGTIRYEEPRTGKRYQLGERVATLLVRPRGLHLPEAHLLQGGEAIPGMFMDFGLFLFHNGRALLDKGSGPYFYLPKLESHREARLWAEIFRRGEELLGLPRGSIRATVLIETLPAAFEMDEIIYELRDYSAGLNCGRWDYIFSFIKKRRMDPAAVLPDRAQVTMTQPFMRAYTQLLIRTCHRRGVCAMGGMAAQIPIRDDAAKNAEALAKVRADKQREFADGHDGTWVAHPGLVPVALEVFTERNQLQRLREDVQVGPGDLLQVPAGTRTLAGLLHNARVGVQYLAAWLAGNGCVPLHNLMEDAATAEICRAQLWQWRRHGARLEDGQVVTAALIEKTIDQVVAEEARGAAAAAALFRALCLAETMDDFLTLPAYRRLLSDVPGEPMREGEQR